MRVLARRRRTRSVRRLPATSSSARTRRHLAIATSLLLLGGLVGAVAIEQVRLVDEFGGDDDRSMAANNSSAFNCRKATGSDRWSEHAFGGAVDINPVQNPYVTGSGAVLPPNGAAHTRRDRATPGLITAGDPVVKAFAAIGWRWGGDWSEGKDYQHFSATGR